ncbi:MAG TPA: hemolysin family protein [Steroidobacteraceae bacterium]
MSNTTLLLAAAGFLLVLLNGFFVAAEFAIVKLRQTQANELARTRGLRGRILLKVRTHLDAYLSACQLGITLASLGLGWIGEPAFARLLEPGLLMAGVDDPQVLHSISFAVAFTFISFLHIVLGELAPKSMAIRRAEVVSLRTALPLYLFHWVMYPFIYVLNSAANAIVRRMGVELATEGDTVHSAEELRSVLLASHSHGELGAVEARLLVHGLELGELLVGDIMRPLADLVWIPVGSPIEEVLAEVRTSRYTRYPVRDPDTGRFVGLLHIKDLLSRDERLRDIKDLHPYLRKLPRIDQEAPLSELLAQFRKGAPHLAIVTDRLDNEIGFVTFELVIEALLGPVQDEFTKTEPRWTRAEDGSLTGPGSLSLFSLEDALGRPVPVVEANSVAGLLIEQLGRIPSPGEKVHFPGFEMEVLSVDGPRVENVRIRPVAREEPD